MTDIDSEIDRTASDRVPLSSHRLEGLLGEPAFATWAREAASEFRLTPLDALLLLAQALYLYPQ
jgi:hypothetical protein